MVSTLCSVSRVQLSVDNAFATVYISSVLDDDSLQASVEALQRQGIHPKTGRGFLNTRNTPVLTFKAVVSLKEGQKINALIDTLVEDGNKR
jgi:ribosome-binding factor A